MLLGQQADNWIGGICVEFGTMRTFHVGDVTCPFHNGALHAQAQAQKGNCVFADIFDGLDFAFNAARAEAAGYYDSIHAFEVAFGAVRFDFFGIDPANVELSLGGDRSMLQSFGHGFVSIVQAYVLAHDRNFDFLFSMLKPIHNALPLS